MKEAMAVIGAVVGMIVLFTLLAGGQFNIGTTATGGPYFTAGFRGVRGG